LFAVADGMGGHAAGEVASRLAIKSLAQAQLSRVAEQENVRHAIREANRVVFDSASKREAARGMGTTCAVLLLAGNVAHLGNVGDSRIYRLRRHVLTQLTRDHNVVGEMIEQGLIAPADAHTDEGHSYLTRALGGGATVDSDVQSVDILPGDRFLLCSDGLSSMIPDEQIGALLASRTDPQDAADALVAAANDAGGEDNITVVVVDPRVSAPRVSRSLRWIALVIAAVLVAATVGAVVFAKGGL
jgi:serine/threonine protein phosphatase PrpC